MSNSISAVTGGHRCMRAVRRTSRPGSRGGHPDNGVRGAMDSVHFIGTATTVIRLGAFTVLTDPNFLHRGQRAYLGKGLWSRRLTEPAIAPSDLPPLDAVVLSHLHGDHFDRIARRELDRTPPVVTTRHAARRLRQQGFTTIGLQDWQRHHLTHGEESLEIEALPAVHARGLMGALLPPVMGSLLTHTRDGVVRRVHVSGDTLTGDHLTRIHARHPDIDVGIVHLGGTRVLWHTVTMDDVMGVSGSAPSNRATSSRCTTTTTGCSGHPWLTSWTGSLPSTVPCA